MTERVKLNELDDLFEQFRFPVDRRTVATELSGVELVYADGQESFVDVLDRVGEQEFTTLDELETTIYNALPVEAVGEPGQSEGEG